jgi:GT2 family glycosyltransferase
MMAPAGRDAPVPRSLSISIVTYAPDLELLGQVLRQARAALAQARSAGVLSRYELVLVDNGPDDSFREGLRGLLEQSPGGEEQLLTGHGNVGYGVANNLAIRQSACDYHLVLNPDVLVAQPALHAALTFMAQHPEVALLSPSARYPDGSRQYLCKRYPSVADLALRGFAPAWMQRTFSRRLAAYEMRDVTGDSVALDVPIVSGCFMLFRRDVLERLHGFCERYFLYFEDFDLSLRAARLGRIAYVPQVQVVHLGGNAARKGWRSVLRFAGSAIRFFARHGWRLA